MIILNNCLTCETETNGKHWCSICEILIPEITDYSLETIPNKKNSESLRKILDYPKPIIRDVWKSFKNIDIKEKIGLSMIIIQDLRGGYLIGMRVTMSYLRYFLMKMKKYLLIIRQILIF